MSTKIGIVGAPGAGKTTFAAKLYAKLLEEGVPSTRLVSEYAQEVLGRNEKIDPQNQVNITSTQMMREHYIQSCNFNPIICDSAVWLAAMYIDDKLEYPLFTKPHELKDYFKYGQMPYKHALSEWEYAAIIYTPLFRNDNQQSQFRIHDYAQAKLIQDSLDEYIIGNDIKKKSTFFQCPANFNERKDFIEDLIPAIKFLMNKDTLYKFDEGKHQC